MEYLRILFTLLFVTLGVLAKAQTANPASGGGEASGSGGSASYTVGLVSYQFVIGPTVSVTEGVQQPYEVLESSKNKCTVILYPNPTPDVFKLDIIGDFNEKKVELRLQNLNGQIVQIRDVILNETFVPIVKLPESAYIVAVYSSGKKVCDSKIIIKNVK
ncbi:hypothetical protein FUAX_54740 (plasmid) [Fulvitalea axinellae]|uniref:Secretion system C-terminal sorting domain-containing protein n=1 Tax=Fulvitalea axinellae TaxID=1182444 RepID=A0AAU9D6M4_9BACT|nr:hypothetical protein FUAX_54740 [Fulvitalea axinellae]